MYWGWAGRCLPSRAAPHCPAFARRVEEPSWPWPCPPSSLPHPHTPRVVDGSVLDPGTNSLDSNPDCTSSLGPPASHLPSLGLHFPICKVGSAQTRTGTPGVQRRPCVSWLSPCRNTLYRSLIYSLPRLPVFMEIKETGRLPGSGCWRVENRHSVYGRGA